jgi:hypothetical protein
MTTYLQEILDSTQAVPNDLLESRPKRSIKQQEYADLRKELRAERKALRNKRAYDKKKEKLEGEKAEILRQQKIRNTNWKVVTKRVATKIKDLEMTLKELNVEVE